MSWNRALIPMSLFPLQPVWYQGFTLQFCHEVRHSEVTPAAFVDTGVWQLLFWNFLWWKNWLWIIISKVKKKKKKKSSFVKSDDVKLPAGVLIHCDYASASWRGASHTDLTSIKTRPNTGKNTSLYSLHQHQNHRALQRSAVRDLPVFIYTWWSPLLHGLWLLLWTS